MQFTSRQLNTVYRLVFGDRSGTAFLYNDGRGDMLVTARQVLMGARAGDKIKLKTNDGWMDIELSAIELHEGGHDVCVFASDDCSRSSPMPQYPLARVVLGDSLYFLGFPHSLENTYPGPTFPVPLVRHVFFSGVVVLDGVDVAILDGFNDFGFAGAPVFGAAQDGAVGLFGVVSGRRREAGDGLVCAAPLLGVTEVAARLAKFIPVLAPRAGSETT